MGTIVIRTRFDEGTESAEVATSERLRDMKYIGFKHQRENKQYSNNTIY
jgi:hypothetical protein